MKMENKVYRRDFLRISAGTTLVAGLMSRGERSVFATSQKTKIVLKPVEMTPSIMSDLERRNLIMRLGPRRHELPAKFGETLDKSVYESKGYGPHKLVTVTVNRVTLPEFGTHPDNEDFLLIGDPSCKPLYVVIALHRLDQLNQKIKQRTLSPDDFVCLHVKYNDAEVSFFTMLANVPHGEAVTKKEGRPPSFYVTEGRDLPSPNMDLGDYELSIAAS
jgi:hypothetical protein